MLIRGLRIVVWAADTLSHLPLCRCALARAADSLWGPADAFEYTSRTAPAGPPPFST